MPAFQYWSRFFRQEDLLCVLGQGSSILSGKYKGSQKACSISYIIALVIFSYIEHILTEQLSLLCVTDAEFSGQIQSLKFNNIILEITYNEHEM